MKTIIRNLLAAIILFAASLQTRAQGLVYDQQSATGPVAVQGNGNADGLDIQEDSPLMQSFIPSLSAIGFVQFEFADIPGNGNNGATVYVNLWTGSTLTNTATFLGSTTPIYMPNGFVNSGLGIAGITNFYFSTPVALTAGQTYYLQPVVLSGDDPWDIITIGDTYPNGRLYGKTGGFFQPSTDFWFREGVVPEPSALALIGLGFFLVCAFKRRSKLPILFFATILPIVLIHAAPDSIVQATADEAGLSRVSATRLSSTGTFWVMTNNPDGSLNELPYPFLPSNLSTLPIYSAVNDIFIVDDTSSQIMPSSIGRVSSAQATTTAQAQAQSVASLIDLIQTFNNGGGVHAMDEGGPPGPPGGGTGGGYQPNYTPLSFDTNSLWLSSSNEAPYVGLRAHNTVGGDHYQLLSTTNLSNHSWDLGQILFYASDGYADFTPVPMTNAMTFFRAHHANPVMEIYNYQDSEELNPTNTSDPGHAGIIYIQNEGSATNDVTVYYSIGGTAQNGVDYSNIAGEVVVPLSSYYAEIDIDPIADGLKPNQTIILTLIQNTNYLIDPAYYSATNNLIANPQVYPVASGDKQFPCPNTQFNYTLQAQDPRNLPLTYTILTYPTHGTLSTNALPNVTYTPTNCYEGQDSFAFTASDGQFTSTPATVTLIIADSVYANSPMPQTCRGASVSFSLGSDNCSETLSYALLSNPAYGTLSGTAANLTYTSTDTNFTGTDSFNYIVYSGCGGDSATGTVAVTVGDEYLYPIPQSVTAGTNRPVSITLSAGDYYDNCKADTNYYTYTVSSGPTNGTLSGSGANLVYTPNHNYEGLDSFQFTASDSVWTSSYPDTVTIFVVAGPVLFPDCDPFGTAVRLDWSLDDVVNNMVQQDGLNISDFIVYRSAVSGGPYTAIATNFPSTPDWMSYLDPNTGVGQTNYYVVTFESPNSTGSTNYESPLSNEIKATGQNPDDLISANALWDVVTNSSNPTNVVTLQAPFSSYGTNQYPGLYPLPHTLWPVGTTWSNHITMFIPSNSVPLSQVEYSIAIDNDYKLYLNSSNAPIETFNHVGNATWSPFKSFEDVAPGLLHCGTNDIRVVIVDDGVYNYFSMVVTTNTCGQ